MSQDREFEKYLEGKSDLSKLYTDLPEIDAPEHLDAAILAEAHRAVNSRPGAKLKRRWTIPLGLVASLIVAVMVGLQLPYMLKDAAQPQQSTEEKMAALMDKSAAEPNITAPVSVEARKRQLTGLLSATSKSDVVRDEPVTQAAKEVAPAMKSVPAAMVSPQIRGNTDRSSDPALASVSPPAAPAPALAKAAGQFELKESTDSFSGVSLSKDKKRSGHAEVIVGDAIEQRSPAPARLATTQATEKDRVLEQSLKSESTVASLHPEDWIKRIRKLKQEGKLEDFKRELAEFRKRNPDFTVPKDIDIR